MGGNSAKCLAARFCTFAPKIPESGSAMPLMQDWGDN